MRDVLALVLPFLAILLLGWCSAARAGNERHCPAADCVQYASWIQPGPCPDPDRNLWFSDGTVACWPGAREPVVVDPVTFEVRSVVGLWLPCARVAELCPWTQD